MNPHSQKELPFFSFSSWIFDFFPINLLRCLFEATK